MSAEDKIAAVLVEHHNEGRGRGMLPECRCGWVGSSNLAWAVDHARHQAAMLAPLVREAQRAAFEVGVTRGIAYQAGNNDALANPYRIEKEA